MTNKLTLLCVEDDTEALEDVVYLLKRYFYKIYTASNGEEALELYNKYNPDMLLLDINIPKINGLEVAKQIRNNDNTTPIVFLTAHSDKDKLLTAIELQVSSYIIKPFKIEELKKTIFKVIEKIDIENSKLKLDNNFLWDKESSELYYKNNLFVLTKNETALIKLLLTHKSTFLTVNEIALDIGDHNIDTANNNIVQLISRFKKKIKKHINSDTFFLENRYGNGYRIK